MGDWSFGWIDGEVFASNWLSYMPKHRDVLHGDSDHDAAEGEEHLIHSAFEERMVSRLPYLEIRSRELFRVSDVNMNNDSIVTENLSVRVESQKK